VSIPGEVRDQLVLRFRVLFPHLNGRPRRLVMGQEARLLGYGGVRAVARAAGVSETTVRAGVFELEAGEDPLPGGRVRRPGGAGGGQRIWILAWFRRYWRWWSRMSAGIRPRRCAGRSSRCGTWPGS
jgi:hypothetical protein